MTDQKAEGEFEPFTMITSEVEKAKAAGLLGQLKAGKEWIQTKHAGVKPWGEFFNVRNVSKPEGASDVTRRAVLNIQRFQSNYLFVFLGLVIYCIVTNPTLLFALGLILAAWWFISVRNKGENIVILGRETGAKELYTVLAVVSLPLFYFAGAGSTVFWIIGASVVVVLVHAIAMAAPDQTVDEEMGIVMADITVS